MKRVYPLSFMLMGIVFLLISTIFYPSITRWLVDLQDQAGRNVPDFWDLPLVLGFVRIIFLIVGAFLTLLGIAFFWMKKPLF